MNNQTRNHLNLQKHIADQDHIIRVRNAEIAALRKRAEKAEQERDEVRDAWEGAVESVKEANSLINSLRAAESRPFTADDITDEMIDRAYAWWEGNSLADPAGMRAMLTAALTAPARPEGAEKVEAVLHQYWSGDINGDDLANRIAEEMNR